MKTLFRSFLIVVVAGLMTAANAQFQIGATFNGIVPVSPSTISDVYEFGFGGTLVARYGLSDNVRIGLDIGYYSHSGKVTGYSASFMPINAVFEYSFATEGFMPYVGAGIGLTSSTIKVDFFGTTAKATSTNFNVAPTLGFRYGLSDNLDLDFNVKYNLIFDDGDTIGLLPIGLGVVYKLD